MQEQYEALRNFRDRQTGISPWQDFLGTGGDGGGPPNATGIDRRKDSPSSCVPKAPCFHMERQSNVGLADYGQWVPCPGQWFPPLDYDSNWTTVANPLDPFFIHYGCQGNANTKNDQPIIQVGITMDAGGGLSGVYTCDYYRVIISADWSTSGTSVLNHASSLLYSYIANTQGVDHYVTSSTCP